MSKQIVGFIGLGVMGHSMASHIQAAGHPLHIFTRTKSKAEDLIANGATWHDTPATLAPECDVIITIVGFPSDVKSIYLDDKGLVNTAKTGATLIDMTTSCPLLAKEIAETAAANNIAVLDAPVSGGDIGAKEARLSIMVGGTQSAFNSAKPILDLMGKNIVYQGPAGSGQHCKMANQIVVAGNMLGCVEALAYAKKSGLDPKTVLSSIESGAAGSWALSNLGPRIIDADFEPGFYVKHFIKDMKIALDSANAMKLDTPGLATALKLYELLAEKGHENDGTQGLFKLYS